MCFPITNFLNEFKLGVQILVQKNIASSTWVCNVQLSFCTLDGEFCDFSDFDEFCDFSDFDEFGDLGEFRRTFFWLSWIESISRQF